MRIRVAAVESNTVKPMSSHYAMKPIRRFSERLLPINDRPTPGHPTQRAAQAIGILVDVFQRESFGAHGMILALAYPSQWGMPIVNALANYARSNGHKSRRNSKAL